MEDIVAIKISDKEKGDVAFLTWGRVHDPTDPGPLLRAVQTAAVQRFGLRNIISIEACESLQAAAGYKYFFEGILAFSGKVKPRAGKTFNTWAGKMRRAIINGKELYFLGGTHEAKPEKRLAKEMSRRRKTTL